MLARAILSYLSKIALLAIIGLLCFGNVPSEDLIRIVLIFIALRLVLLAVEAFQRPIPEDQWSAWTAELTQFYEGLPEAERQTRAQNPGLPPLPGSPSELARMEIDLRRRRYQPPRPRLELCAEVLGLLAFTLLLPAAIGMATRPFFSFNRFEETRGVLVLAACLALYGLPFLRIPPFRGTFARSLWWATPFFPALFAMLLLVAMRHPYLNPFNPDHHRLAAERIVAMAQLGNNVAAASHVDWIFRHARDLESRGETAPAIDWYERGLQLAPDRADARARLVALRPADAPTETSAPAIDTYAPLWPDDISFSEVPRRQIDPDLRVDASTVVLVPLGDIPEVLLAAIAYSIHRELGLPVLAADAPMSLSAADRTHGLLVGEQWNVGALDEAFRAAYAFPSAPIKYLLVTDHDIYMDGTNYVFSASFSWGAIVSAARFIAISPDDAHIVARTTKQALGALLKSFGVPASSDRACVTSYVRSPEEFDRKGNRPTAETLALFREAVAEWNRTWPDLRATAPTENLEDLHQQLEQLAAPSR